MRIGVNFHMIFMLEIVVINGGNKKLFVTFLEHHRIDTPFTKLIRLWFLHFFLLTFVPFKHFGILYRILEAGPPEAA
jgi:hypothetical protein